MAVSPTPAGYHSITPYLSINDAAAAIEFYKKAFGASETLRIADPKSGKVGHADLLIGNSHLMLADEFPEMNFRGPKALGGTPVNLMIYVADVDKVFAQALAAGAKEVRPVQDQFYGDRLGVLEDPFGHQWSIATHIEDVSNEEVQKRAAAAYG